jgi:serine/threonine protein kinase/tetratricopeptide (TPR) repeat protein
MPNPTPDPLAPLVEVWLRSAEPAAALEQLCREHPDLADDLRAHIDTIARPTATLEVANEQAGRDTAAMPQEIGPYRLRDILGEGGMGTVYLAEQKHPVQRRVALKLIKLGMDSKAIIQRFQQERQALALMDHEGIAKVFDCGTSERGQPYFVMELVKGVPIDEFCEQQRLSLQDRLELIQQVCSAVQHAHQKGVVHRDLKPGNVLVTSDAGRYQVKIIDFGLAKAIGSKLIQESLVSELGVVIGTPEYMAPEQANPSNLDIDTRVDIYSIGVMLYEVLVGELPFSGDDLRQAGPVEMQRILREVDPPKPSTQLTTMGPASSGIAHRRRVSVSTLKKALKTDLDWVVLKALEKDRNRRYGSATALAEDLQRYLDHEPLQAGPPSAMNRLQKLLRRHRGTVTAAALVLVTLVGGGIGTFAQWRRAEQRAAELEVVAQFQQDQFRGVNPHLMGLRWRDALRELLEEQCKARGLGDGEVQTALAAHDERMRGVDFTGLALRSLDENFFVPGLKVLDTKFEDQPLLQARLRQTVAAVLHDLGRLQLATKPQQQATEARRQLLGDEDRDTLVSTNQLAQLLESQGQLTEAELLYRRSLEISRRVLGDEDRDTLALMRLLGGLLDAQSKPSEAEPILRQSLEVSRRVLGDDDQGTLVSLSRLAGCLLHADKLVEAEALYREGLEIRRRVNGEDHRETITSMMNLSQVLQYDRGKWKEAESLMRQSLEASRRVLGDDHVETLSCINNWALFLTQQGKLAEAEPLYRELVQRCGHVLGGDHQYTLVSINNLGQLLRAQRKFSEAERLLRKSLSERRRRLGDTHEDTLTSINNLGLLLEEQGKLDDAEKLYREALEGRRSKWTEDHRLTLQSIGNLGNFLQDQGKLAEAEPLLRRHQEISRRFLGDQDHDTLAAVKQLVKCLNGLGRLDDARAVLNDFLTTTKLSADHEHVTAVKLMLEDLDKKK